MNTRISPLYTLALISLLSLFTLSTQASAQTQRFNRLGGPPRRRLMAEEADRTRALGVPSSDFTSLYSFCSVGGVNCTDGAVPVAGVIQDASGNLYGTTLGGGSNNTAACDGGCGTVFELNGNFETVLYNFCSMANCTDGYEPFGGLLQNAAGNLFGTTFYGGNSASAGVIFELEQEDSKWTFKVLYTFCAKHACADGENPAAGLIEDSEGNLYGTTEHGGAYGYGTVFKFDPVDAQETVLWSFGNPNLSDGMYPEAGLILDPSSGDLYGTTSVGGEPEQSGDGTVFRLTSTGQETILHVFCTQLNCADGVFPETGLIEDSAGNLYGTAGEGGVNMFGVAFELVPATKTYTVLYAFCSEGGANCTDGAYPAGGLLLDGAGDIYGTTYGGGAGNAGCNIEGLPTCGTVFELASPAKPGAAWSETVLYSFCSESNCTDGSNPAAGLIENTVTGDLYGTTSYGGTDIYAQGDSGGGTVFQFAIGTGGGPAVTLSPTSLKFGTTDVGKTSAAKKVTLTNSGTATLDITTITVSGDFALATVKKTKKVTPCANGGTVAAGATCEIAVTFTPLQTGTLNGDVTFTDNARNSPQQLPLTGTGKD